FKEQYLYNLTSEQRAIVTARMEGKSVPYSFVYVPDFNTSSLTPQQLEDYKKFQSINSAIDGPADDDEHRDWRDRAIYSGGVEKAVSDLDNIPWDKTSAPQGYKGPTLEDLRAEAGEKQYWKEMHIDLMSEHAQKTVLEALHKKLKAAKPEDL